MRHVVEVLEKAEEAANLVLDEAEREAVTVRNQAATEAEEEAERILSEARSQAVQTRAEAESYRENAAAEADERLKEAWSEAEELLNDTRDRARDFVSSSVDRLAALQEDVLASAGSASSELEKLTTALAEATVTLGDELLPEDEPHGTDGEGPRQSWLNRRFARDQAAGAEV